MTLLLGIDVGTTGVRASAFDREGAVVAEASFACPHDAPRPGHAEADAERWWEATGAVCRRVLAGISPGDIVAVGVTGQAPTAVLLDERAQVLRPAILWLDVRAAPEARALDASLGPGRAEAIGGNRMHAYFLGPKLAWLRAHEPQVLDRTRLVVQSHAFVAMRLTGVAACDRSTAMLCAPLYDVRADAWSEEAARAIGIPASVLPPIVRADDILGHVTAEGAAQTGLQSGTPVVAGGGDFAASALGAGVTAEGQACLMLGTAGNLLLPMNAPRFDARLLNSHHVGCDAWLALGGTLCGAALEWFRRTLAAGADWESIEAEAAAVPVGAEGVVMLPYLQGERTPVWDEAARGAFFGLSLDHGRGHLARALFEGIALGFAHCLAIARQSGIVVRRAVAANGAGKSPLLCQSLADAMNVPVEWSSHGSATVWGAAALAGLGSGVWHAARDLPKLAPPPKNHRHHTPDPRAHERLSAVAERRAAFYRAEVASRGGAG